MQSCTAGVFNLFCQPNPFDLNYLLEVPPERLSKYSDNVMAHFFLSVLKVLLIFLNISVLVKVIVYGTYIHLTNPLQFPWETLLYSSLEFKAVHCSLKSYPTELSPNIFGSPSVIFLEAIKYCFHNVAGRFLKKT